MKKILFLTLFLLITISGFSQNFTVSEYQTIYDEAINLMEKYNENIKLISDKETDQATKEQSFIPMFESIFFSADKTYLYNDLDPTGKTGDGFNPGDYAKNIILFYPNKGIDMNLKTTDLKFGVIHFESSVNQYYFDIQVNKTIKGTYQDTQPYNTTQALIFRFSFDKTTKLENFKIAGVRKYELKFKISNKKVRDKDFMIDKTWWSSLDENWRALLKTGAAITKEPTDKDLLVIRQFISANKEGNLIFSPSAFTIPTLVSDLIPLKKKKAYLTTAAIVLSSDNLEFTAQLENGEVRNFSKSEFKIRSKKTDEELQKLQQQVNKLVLDSVKYLLTLENGISLPVRIKDNTQELKIWVTSEAFGNKAVPYSLHEIKEIVEPVKRKGIYVSPVILPASTGINDKTISWTPSNKFGFSAGVDLSYFFTESFGIATGFRYTVYNYQQRVAETGASIDSSGYFKDNNIDLYQHYDVVDPIVKKGTIQSIDIPVIFKLVLAEEVYKKGYYVNAGIIYSLKVSDKSSYSGTYNKYVKVKDIPGLDPIVSPEYDGGTKTASLPATEYKSAINVYASGGIIIPLKNGRNFITAGVSYRSALSAINSNTTFKDMFGREQTSTTKPILFGVEIGLHFKLK